MTTIVYKDGELACDSRMSSGHTIITDENVKSGQTDSFLFAAAGDAGLCDIFLLWGADNFDPRTKPTPPQHIEEFGDFAGLAVDRSLNVFLYDINFNPIACGKIKQFAIGSGGDYARGALAMGATIVQSVEVAMSLDLASGGRVVVRRFPTKKGQTK